MTGNRTTLILALAVLVVAGLVAAPATASAQSDDGGVIDTLFGADSTDDEDGILGTATNFARGTLDKYTQKYLGGGSEQADAKRYVENVKAAYNPNSDAVENWTNARVSASTEYDVARIKLQDSDGGSAWLFVVADISGTEYANTRLMNLSEFRDVDREIDLDYKLTPYASRNAADELETFISEYVGPGDDVTGAYLAQMAGQYRGEVSGDDLPGRDR